jgi:acyl-CoA hydrolase
MYISHEPTPAAARIAALVAELLPRNPTVQLGIGAVPEAVTVALGEGGLGTVRLVGMGSDHLVRLFDTGALRRSDTFPNSAVTAVELLGTRTILDAAHENPAIGVVSSSTCHDPRWLATLPRLVSVNSALQVDLTGQVSGEGIGGRVLAGVGGSFDFFEGARASDGGLRIVALESTTDGGETSKIVPALGEGSAVSIPRHSVDVVVTEHGVARLAGRSLAERIDGLIGVASPSHRHALADSR